jgi:hypothetical protein
MPPAHYERRKSMGESGENNYREIWRKNCKIGSPSIQVTDNGDIGITIGGDLIIAPIEKWHKWATFVSGAPSGSNECEGSAPMGD